KVTHPSPDTLQAFGLGKLDDITAEPVIRHLDECPDCRRIVAEIPGDGFLDRLRGARPTNSTVSPGSLSSQPSTGKKGKPPAPTSVPPELASNAQHEIVRELGRGGMGVVYLANNKLMGRPEVLKVINKALLDHPSAVDRFLREIQMAAKLGHENVVRAY